MRGSVVKNLISRRHSLGMPGRDQASDCRLKLIALVLTLIAVTAWSYWPTMMNLFNTWQTDEDYSAGQLVPLVALFLFHLPGGVWVLSSVA